MDNKNFPNDLPLHILTQLEDLIVGLAINTEVVNTIAESAQNSRHFAPAACAVEPKH